MKKVLVLYYSRSGNTEKMAKAVVEGLQSVGDVAVDLSYHVDASELRGYDAIVFGVPTYRKEMPMEFQKLFEEAATNGVDLKGKIGAAFGSFGWNAEAPQKVLVILREKFGMQTPEQPVFAKYIPDQATLDACRNLGKKIAETLKNQP